MGIIPTQLLQRLLTSTILESTLLVLSAGAVHLSLSPPNPPVNRCDCYFGKERTSSFFEIFVQSITWCSKMMMWIGSICNLMKLVAESWTLDSEKLSMLSNACVSSSPRLWNDGTYPFVLFLGTFCIIGGTSLRLWCFKSLGPLFTFELTIRPEHQLVTHGPYAWVRHPSYTGIYLTLAGATLVLIGPGTWMKECGMKKPFGIIFSCLWLVKCFFAFHGMQKRYQTEDRVLGETFGKEWEEYASRVPHKFIPCIL